MTYDKFEIGRAYFATPALVGARQRIVIPIGREGGDIQFAFVDGLANASVECISGLGREVVRINVGDGHVYCVSCACEVPAADSARVMELMRAYNDR